jgi:predicted chitinase
MIKGFNEFKKSLNEEAGEGEGLSSFMQFLVNKRREARGLSALQGIKQKTGEEVDIQDVPGVSPVKGEIDIESPSVPEKEMVKKIVTALKKYGIVNPLVQKAILSVIGKESGFKIGRDEVSYKGTSNSRIRNIFGKRVKNLSDDELTQLKSNDSKFWDRVYGPADPTGMSQKYGNTSKGDGAKYLGRGFNQITFKSNYKKYMDLLSKNGTVADLVNSPKLLYDPEIAAEVNALYFVDGLASKFSKKKYGNDDPNDFKDFKTALKAATNANAGWGRNIEGSEDLRKAEAYSAKFDVTDISKMA